jgi:hypothetical protein
MLFRHIVQLLTSMIIKKHERNKKHKVACHLSSLQQGDGEAQVTNATMWITLCHSKRITSVARACIYKAISILACTPATSVFKSHQALTECNAYILLINTSRVLPHTFDLQWCEWQHHPERLVYNVATINHELQHCAKYCSTTAWPECQRQLC